MLVTGERHDEALASLERGIALGAEAPTVATAHYLAGRTLLGLGRDDEAATDFQRAIERDPDHAEALDHLALWRFGRQEYEQALALYRVHADLAPDDPTVHANTGVTLYFLGRREEALESPERALQLDPGQEMARRLAAELREAAVQAPRSNHGGAWRSALQRYPPGRRENCPMRMTAVGGAKETRSCEASAAQHDQRAPARYLTRRRRRRASASVGGRWSSPSSGSATRSS